MKVKEGALEFRFPAKWEAEKYDDWSFYRNQFRHAGGGTKAADFVAIDGVGCVWLIEIKDYRQHARTKPIELPDEFTRKALDTMSGLVAASFKANEAREQSFAKRALAAKTIRLALQLEQSKKHSKLFPRAFDPATVQSKIRQLLRAVDPHARVFETSGMTPPWSVRAACP